MFSVAAQDGDDAQDLDVQPDHGHRQAEGAAPGVDAGHACLGGAFDVLEVHHQRIGGHGHGQAADDQPDPAGPQAVADHQHVADVDQHEQQVGDDGDAEDLVQLRRGAQDPEAVHDQHGAGDGEGAEHGLKGDARTDELHQPADAAEEQALQACVGEHQGRRGLLLEDVHQGGDEAADQADDHGAGGEHQTELGPLGAADETEDGRGHGHDEADHHDRPEGGGDGAIGSAHV